MRNFNLQFRLGMQWDDKSEMRNDSKVSRGWSVRAGEGKRSNRFPQPAANSAIIMSTCRLAFAAVVVLLFASVASQGPECKSGSHPSVMAVAQSCVKGQLFCKDVQVDVVEFDMDSPASSMKVLHPAVIPNFPHKQAFLSTVLSASDASNAYFFFPSPSPLLLTVPLSGMRAPLPSRPPPPKPPFCHLSPPSQAPLPNTSQCQL